MGGENGGEEGGCLDLGLRMPAYPWHTPTNNLQLEAGQEQRLPECPDQWSSPIVRRGQGAADEKLASFPGRSPVFGIKLETGTRLMKSPKTIIELP